MRTFIPTLRILTNCAVAAFACLTLCAQAAEKTWDGGGADNFWQTGVNWNSDSPPSAGDVLKFTGTSRLSNTNNFGAGTAFAGISFDNPAGAFTLRGSQIALGGDIADNQVVTLQTIALPLALSGVRTVNVTTDGLLNISGVISGAGSGIIKTGGGLLTLSGTNTFSGPVSINAGTLSVSTDSNLGAAPGSATPARIVINGGTLLASSTFSLSANRGIALGPNSGSGGGTFDIGAGIALSYGGIIANNGGNGGLNKTKFGGLTLSGANTYTGPTAVKNGTLTLDFTQAASPANNIINSASSLILGGETAGVGTTNFAALIVNGKASTANSQTFNGTLVDLGAAQIRANGGAGGSANIALGSLTHNLGGVLSIIPPAQTGGTGNVTTTATNVNGILAGWALVSDGTVSLQGGTTGNPIPPAVGTNLASVDASGNIVPYTNYTVYSEAAGDVGGIMFGTNNVLIGSDVVGTSLRVDADHDPGQGSKRDVNTITFNRSVNNWSLNIGSNNTLRLGKTGALFSQYRAGSPTWGITSVPGGVNNLGQAGNQDVGILTAGGPTDNTPGEIIVHLSQAGSGSANNMVIDTKITDNGSGPVTVVKAGPGFFKLRGHNTYSGGTYVLQGRIQLSGSEVGTSNPDGIGTGPLYLFPGAYLFFAGTGSPITNAMFIAGDAARQEQGIGVIRTSGGWEVRGNVTLIGDATIGGNGGVSGGIAGKISGPFALNLCPAGTVNGSVSISNPSNDWTGTTTMQARNNTGTNVFINGTNECIPNGFGKGNVNLLGYSAGTIMWNLNGFSETINGLSTPGNGATCFILNNGANPSVLTVGDNDQSGTYGGLINNGSGTLALTKIGGGSLTLTGANAYSGDTTVNGGTLAVSGSGSISSSANIFVNHGATLDVSGGSAGFSTTGALNVNGGSLLARATGSPGLSALNLTNSRVRLSTLGGTNVETATLTIGGGTNLIDVISVGLITSYPTQFTVIKYTGALSGVGFNFGLGSVPSPSTVGFVSNNAANSSVDLVLLDGPKPLTWTGTQGSEWDFAKTNWLAFGTTPVAFLDADSAIFRDGAGTNLVNLTTLLQPGSVIVSNQALPYTFVGSGSLSGFGNLVKDGAGTLILANSGVSDFKGGLTVNNGTLALGTDQAISGGTTIALGATVQVGTNGPSGTLPSGTVANDGTLLLSRSDDFVLNSPITGSGVVRKLNANTATLGGVSADYSGQILVAQGTLKAGGALGGANAITVVSNAATLDVNGQNLVDATVRVRGVGVGGNGAIVNSGADQINALGNVILEANTSFGGTSRWDIRGGVATLSTEGNAFNLTKTGTNQMSLVGVTVDGALGSIAVQQGMFSVETTTGELGNTANPLTVASGATLQLWSTTYSYSKPVVLNGDGLVTTLNVGNGVANTLAGPVTLNGSCILNAAGNTALTLSGTVSGSGNVVKTGAGTNVLVGTITYSGATTVSNGTLLVNSAKGPAAGITVQSGGILGGWGTIAEPVAIGANGVLAPGDANAPMSALAISHTLTLAGTVQVDVLKSGGQFQNDVITNVTVLTLGGRLQVNVDTNGEALANGDAIKLFSFTTAGGNVAEIVPATPGGGLFWDKSQLTVNGTLRVTNTSPEPPTIDSITVTGGNVVISGTGGVAGNAYYVRSSTNVSLPAGNWPRVLTNQFHTDGSFSVTNAVSQSDPERYYRVELP